MKKRNKKFIEKLEEIIQNVKKKKLDLCDIQFDYHEIETFELGAPLIKTLDISISARGYAEDYRVIS